MNQTSYLQLFMSCRVVCLCVRTFLKCEEGWNFSYLVSVLLMSYSNYREPYFLGFLLSFSCWQPVRLWCCCIPNKFSINIWKMWSTSSVIRKPPKCRRHFKKRRKVKSKIRGKRFNKNTEQMDVNEFREFGRAAIDFLADYFENIRDRLGQKLI